MNLGHLLPGTDDYKLGLSVIDQKAVRKHPGTDISNTVLDNPQRNILRHRWVWSERQIDLGVVGVTVPDQRIPKQLLYGELASGKRSVGGQRKRFKDSLKTSLKAMNIDWESWESHALDRPHWRHLVSTGSKTSEQSRLAAAREKRATRKARSASTSTAVTDYKCSTCGRYFRARIGLVSHLRTHLNQ